MQSILKEFLKKFYIVILGLIFALIYSVLNHLHRGFLTCLYIWPAPRFFFPEMESISLFPILLAVTVAFYLTGKHRLLNMVIGAGAAVFYIVVLAVNFHSVSTLAERADNIKKYRFPISEMDIQRRLDVKDHFETYGVGNKIIVFGKAGCPDCEELYPDLEKLAGERPVAISYFDCYAGRIYSEEKLEELLHYFKIDSVPTIIAIKNSEIYRFEYGDNTLSNFEAFLDGCAREQYYFTDFGGEYSQV